MDWNDEANLLGFSKKNKRALNNESSASGRSDLPPELNLTNKKGGWADEGTKLKSKSKTNLIEQERFKEQRIGDSDDDIPTIPDIEDLQEEPDTERKLKPQLPTVNNMTYRELDFELSTEGNYPLSGAKLKTKTGDISLTLLTKFLYPEKDVKAPDIPWTMDSLWKDITKTDSNK